MFVLIVAIAVINIIAGFGVAWALEIFELRSTAMAPVPFDAGVAFPPSSSSVPDDPPPQQVPETPNVNKDVPSATLIPSDWEQSLKQASEIPTSVVEAAIHVFRVEMIPYRETLLNLYDRIRNRLEGKSDDTLVDLVAEMRVANSNWLKRQNDAMHEIACRRAQLAHLESIAGELEEVLMQQAAEVETSLGNVDVVYLEPNQELAIGRLKQEVNRLTTMVNLFDVRMVDALTAVLRLEGRLQSIGPVTGHCTTTGLMNRIGAEAAFDDWRREDLGRKRLATYALLDVDQCSRLNDATGPQAVDQILTAFCKLIATECEATEQRIELFRMSGQSLLAFLPDRSIEQGVGFVEELRITVATKSDTVEIPEQRVTISCAVTPLEPSESFLDVSGRLFRGMKEAKRAGRNRTARLEAMRSKVEIVS